MDPCSTKNCVQVRVPGELDSLSLLRSIVTHTAERAGLQTADVNQMEMAVDEACTNIIEHGYASLSTRPDILLSVQVVGNKFIVEITDFGTPFDVESYTPPSFPEHWEGGNTRGAGVFLIKQCMDETAYESLPEHGNKLRLVKYVPPNNPHG